MTLATDRVGLRVAAVDGGWPWAIFPNTNPLGQEITTAYGWESADVSQLNAGQPAARTVPMDVRSPQAGGTAWGPRSLLEYEIVLRNPEAEAFSDLTIDLTASEGLGYMSVSGANRVAGAEGDAT